MFEVMIENYFDVLDSIYKLFEVKPTSPSSSSQLHVMEYIPFRGGSHLVISLSCHIDGSWEA